MTPRQCERCKRFSGPSVPMITAYWGQWLCFTCARKVWGKNA